jgi:hypothetical protein
LFKSEVLFLQCFYCDWRCLRLCKVFRWHCYNLWNRWPYSSLCCVFLSFWRSWMIEPHRAVVSHFCKVDRSRQLILYLGLLHRLEVGVEIVLKLWDVWFWLLCMENCVWDRSFFYNRIFSLNRCLTRILHCFVWNWFWFFCYWLEFLLKCTTKKWIVLRPVWNFERMERLTASRSLFLLFNCFFSDLNLIV